MVKRMEVTTEIGIHSRITEDWRRIDTEDCFAADMLRNECCVGYWKAGPQFA